MNLVVPTYPFAPDVVRDAEETHALFLGMQDELGADLSAWSSDMADPAFLKCLASHWAFLFASAPTRPVAQLLTDILQVSEEQFSERLRTGTIPFAP